MLKETEKLHRIETDIPQDLFAQVEPWVKPLLESLGEFEWGKHGFIVTSDAEELCDERGWIVRKVAAHAHYQVGIQSFKGNNGQQLFCFFIKTGGETIVSRALNTEALTEALTEAMNNGPTHLAPPGRRNKKNDLSTWLRSAQFYC